jgi:hypothetical protein
MLGCVHDNVPNHGLVTMYFNYISRCEACSGTCDMTRNFIYYESKHSLFELPLTGLKIRTTVLLEQHYTEPETPERSRPGQ